MSTLRDLPLAELRTIAGRLKLTKFSKLRKAVLLEQITERLVNWRASKSYISLSVILLIICFLVHVFVGFSLDHVWMAPLGQTTAQQAKGIPQYHNDQAMFTWDIGVCVYEKGKVRFYKWTEGRPSSFQVQFRVSWSAWVFIVMYSQSLREGMNNNMATVKTHSFSV
jgi:hypothetical protein